MKRYGSGQAESASTPQKSVDFNRAYALAELLYHQVGISPTAGDVLMKLSEYKQKEVIRLERVLKKMYGRIEYEPRGEWVPQNIGTVTRLIRKSDLI